MRSRLVRIGNSRGIRLPKPLIEEAELLEKGEVRARQGSIIIPPLPGVRARWAEAAQRLQQRTEHVVLDEPASTRFDRKEWKW